MSIGVGDFANAQDVTPGSSFTWAATTDNGALLEWPIPAGMENNFKVLLGVDKVVPIPATRTNATALEGMQGTVRSEGGNIRVEFQATLVAGEVRADYKLNVLAKPLESSSQ
jgi:hypothetical protein